MCSAKNDALLDGLLTLFHVERSTDALLNAQNDLPLLSDYDKECLAALGQVRVRCVCFFVFCSFVVVCVSVVVGWG